MELFLEPGVEVLIARDGGDVADIMAALTRQRAHEIGDAACRRILRQHTYDRRAETVVTLLRDTLDAKRQRALA